MAGSLYAPGNGKPSLTQLLPPPTPGTFWTDLAAKPVAAKPSAPKAATPVKAGPVMAGRPGHQYPAGALAQFQHESAVAAVPAVRAYNKASGGTQGIVPGIAAHDLAAIRAAARQNPQAAAAVGQLTNPVEWGIGAVKGAQQLGHGVSQIVHGNGGGGAANAGLGALGVAGILPFGRIGELVRTDAEAAAHIAEASQAARAEGHGIGGIGKPPVVESGVTTPETGGETGAFVREALSGAQQARKAQAPLYAAERAARAGRAKSFLDRGDYEGALNELKGALPKVDFQGFKEFTPETQRAMESHLMHPDTPLRPYERVGAIDALRGAYQGKVPTQSQQRLLERAFGKDASNSIAASAKQIRSWPKILVNLANVPRSIMASTDLSAPFRQGLVVAVSHPALFAKAFAPMIKAAKSEPFFQSAIQDEIHARQTYPLMRKAKVAFTDIGESAKRGTQPGADREEQFMSNYAEQIPGLGRVIRGSDRAYTGFLNKVRADVFDHLVQQAARQGLNVGDQKFLSGLGEFVNAATGRGTIKALADHSATLNALFFSPRLLQSRLQFFNPLWYARLDPFVRRQALQAFVGLGATSATLVKIAQMGGAKIVSDPTNADFGKIRIGNTRVDFYGGFQQPVRLAAQLYENKLTSSTTGKVVPLGTGFAATTRLDLVQAFLRGKASPIPGIIYDSLKGTDFSGKPIKWSQLSTWERMAGQNMVPFLAQDIYQEETAAGPGAAAAIAPLDLFGVSIQEYGAKKPAGPSGNYGSSDYAPVGGGGSGSIYAPGRGGTGSVYAPGG